LALTRSVRPTGKARRINTGHSRRANSRVVASENSVHLTRGDDESEHDRRMIAIGLLFVRMLCDCFKSRRRLEAEILMLRHQQLRRSVAAHPIFE
jgi:hypothetical protein